MRWSLVLGVITVATQSFGVIIENFDSATLDSQWMFRAPGFSGSTSGNLEPDPNIGRVINMPLPPNPNGGSGRVYEASWSFKWDAPHNWVRLTTFNATGTPNPRIDFSQKLYFQMWTNAPIRVALGLREVPVDGAPGSNGGTSGAIEWVSGFDLRTDGQVFDPGGQLYAENQWHQVQINLQSIGLGTPQPGKVAGFTGNGILDSTGGYVLEHIAFTGVEGHSDYQVFLDNFAQSPTPEPMTMIGLGLGAAFLARKKKKRV
ncbi:MAG: PEP-CTERM sorting domain-containing protein [Armatimonadetes bacterium]|nr:PEP-CTERM sorting domain-containing protein [Armatimonadota bacterium]